MKDGGKNFSIGGRMTERIVETGSGSVHTVNITHLLRRSQTGDAEDQLGWSEVCEGNTRVREKKG